MQGNRNSFRSSNLYACYALRDILKTSLGPKGMDKMFSDEFGRITITNDGATIMNHIKSQQQGIHPVLSLLVDLANAQDV